jgi:dihydropteroate synthase
MKWGEKTYVMGIVNVTPDSFSGDGVTDAAAAVAQGVRMEAEGADILDIGGESTRPGSMPVSLEDELSRVIPVVEELARKVRIPVSIDTYKAEVARQAISALRQAQGEQALPIINDVWGGRIEPDILHVAVETGAHIVLMHNRSEPKNAAQSEKLGGRYVGVEYEDLLSDIKKELQQQVDAALAAGVKKERIILDPGIGFGKTVEQNLELVRRFDELKELGYPLLAGPSRKSFVGYTLDLPPDERLEGTLAAVTMCIERGADIVRVHDVREVDRVRRLADAVIRR